MEQPVPAGRIRFWDQTQCLAAATCRRVEAGAACVVRGRCPAARYRRRHDSSRDSACSCRDAAGTKCARRMEFVAPRSGIRTIVDMGELFPQLEPRLPGRPQAKVEHEAIFFSRADAGRIILFCSQRAYLVQIGQPGGSGVDRIERKPHVRNVAFDGPILSRAHLVTVLAEGECIAKRVKVACRRAQLRAGETPASTVRAACSVMMSPTFIVLASSTSLDRPCAGRFLGMHGPDALLRARTVVAVPLSNYSVFTN